MKCLSLFLGALLACCLPGQTQAAAGGDGTRGGGNAVRCDDGKVYAWDYVNRVKSQMPLDPALAKLTTAEEILMAISRRLEHVNMPMAKSLEEFSKLNPDLQNPNNHYLWLGGSEPLAPVGDETRLRIPTNCIAAATPNTVLYQAVVREGSSAPGEKVVFNFNAPILAELEANGPLQLSYLYVHEWLRDFISDSNRLPPVVQLLHSGNWATAAEISASLSSFGLILPPPGLVSGEYAIPGEPGEAHPGSPFPRFRMERGNNKATLTPLQTRSMKGADANGPWNFSLPEAIELSVSGEGSDQFLARGQADIVGAISGDAKRGKFLVEIRGSVMDTNVICLHPKFSLISGSRKILLPSQDFFCLDDVKMDASGMR